MSLYKKEGCEILMGGASTLDVELLEAVPAGIPAQAAGQRYRAAVPKGIESMGETVTTALAELHWHPTYPFVSSLTG